jgi:hypothetical protein
MCSDEQSYYYSSEGSFGEDESDEFDNLLDEF